MKLARVIRSDFPWLVKCPPAVAPVQHMPAVDTIVQYEQDVDGVYEVYFPGIPGYAPIGDYGFSTHFEDLDDETSQGDSYRGYMGAD